MRLNLEADYVIIGAGAVALAFADTLLTETDADLIIVDRRAKPGGHWNDAYPFVRLHSPSLNYGVNSRELGGEALDETGINRGFHHLASGGEVHAYFDALMHERLLPSGRVTYLPEHDYVAGEAISLTDRNRVRLRAKKRVVDATLTGTQVPSTQPPPFSVAPGVNLIAPNALPHTQADHYVIIGAGKTALDSIVWLLERGVSAGAITWIKPREAWLLPRPIMQPTLPFFASTFGAFAGEMEAARDATSLDDLFARLEAADLLWRVDRTVKPTMYRCAIISEAELDLLRQVRNVVRRGRVTALEPQRIRLDEGDIAAPPGAVFVNCTADGIPRLPSEPIFQDGAINLQYVRRCSPTFSAAFVGFIEAAFADDAQKNAFCTPVPPPHHPIDWARMHLQEARNRRQWAQAPEIQTWLLNARLDRFQATMAEALRAGDPAHGAILMRYGAATKPALKNLSALLEPA